MSEARSTILATLRAAAPPSPGPPRRTPAPAMPTEPIPLLRARVEQAGGRLVHVQRQDLPDALGGPVDPRSTDHVYSALAELPSRGAGKRARRPEDLADLSLCVVAGRWAVVENGAIWQVPSSSLERAAVLLAEHLVVVVPDTALVATLHDLYERVDLAATGFGWLLAGPSKTADIEQALVLGAHGPRTATVVLVGDP